MKRKYAEIMEEVLDEIKSALEDARGISIHQRRLAFALSLGVATLIESYLDGQNVLKPGAKINHLWLKKKMENASVFISKQITCPIENLKKFDEFLGIAYKIEKERNEIAYGKKISEEDLKNKINLFFELKKETENA